MFARVLVGLVLWIILREIVAGMSKLELDTVLPFYGTVILWSLLVSNFYFRRLR